MEILLQPWPWYVSGPLIAFVMLLLLMSGKNFGMSSNLRTFCTMCGAHKASDFFKFNWKENRWNLWVVLGTIVGGYLGSNFLPEVSINPEVVTQLQNYGFDQTGGKYLPESLFSNQVFSDIKSLSLLVIGGFLVGFGARYAGGCTSGHAISGLSNLQLPSLIAVVGFFIGGLTMVHFIFPLIF